MSEFFTMPKAKIKDANMTKHLPIFDNCDLDLEPKRHTHALCASSQ